MATKAYIFNETSASFQPCLGQHIQGFFKRNIMWPVSKSQHIENWNKKMCAVPPFTLAIVLQCWSVGQSVRHWSRVNIYIYCMSWIAMKYCTDIYGSQWLWWSLTSWNTTVTFILVVLGELSRNFWMGLVHIHSCSLDLSSIMTSSGQTFTLGYDTIPAKLDIPIIISCCLYVYKISQ